MAYSGSKKSERHSEKLRGAVSALVLGILNATKKRRSLEDRSITACNPEALKRRIEPEPGLGFSKTGAAPGDPLICTQQEGVSRAAAVVPATPHA